MFNISVYDFHTKDAYLPVGSDILFLGTGSSVVYNMYSILQYIKDFNPIIIGINVYFHGINIIKKQNLHKEFFRKDISLSKFPERITDSDFLLLVPDIIYTNYFFQEESHHPNGTVVPFSKRGNRQSSILTESVEDNLFHNNIIKYFKDIKLNNIYINYLKQDWRLKNVYGSLHII